MKTITINAKPSPAGAVTRAPSLRQRLLALPRRRKRLLQIIADTVLIWAALWLSFYLRLDDIEAIEPFGIHAWLFLIAPAITVPAFASFGLYRTVMRYAGHQTIAIVALATMVASAIMTVFILPQNVSGPITPRSITAIYWLLSTALCVGIRMTMRQYFRGMRLALPASRFTHAPEKPGRRQRVAIYGAGAAGNQLLMALRLGSDRHPVVFIDDNPDLAGRVIAGLPVHAPSELHALLRDKNLSEVLLAIPSASRYRRAEIVKRLTPYPVSVRTIPGFMDLASGRVKVQDLREVDISDLLGRDPVQPRPELFERCIKHQVVMVTGAGGSIGSELCRQILACAPRTLILYEQCEFNLYSIQREMEAQLKKQDGQVEIVPVLASVRDEERLFNVMSIWEVDTVYHAAAYKHVPMVERNIAEGIMNNVFGTLYSAQAALRAGVRNFVLISTDKAVRPTSTMGSTKRLAELVLQALARHTSPRLFGRDYPTAPQNRTRFTMVRFGNVLGSSGSVIPLFREQIRNGGPITVTHPDINRYFMTIPEASQLVIQAGAMGKGGDVFVLDMGEPVKIVDLALNMIRLSGLTLRSPQNPGGDIAVEFVGLRPGEKLYEELLIGENVIPTEHPMILRANEAFVEWETLILSLRELQEAVADDDYLAIRKIFHQLVDGYSPDREMVDWVHVQQIASHAVMPTAVILAKREPARVASMNL